MYRVQLGLDEIWSFVKTCKASDTHLSAAEACLLMLRWDRGRRAQ